MRLWETDRKAESLYRGHLIIRKRFSEFPKNDLFLVQIGRNKAHTMALAGIYIWTNSEQLLIEPNSDKL